MKPKVYIETTIPSYLTSIPSRDPLVAANQRQTREWWDNHRGRYDLFVSNLVLSEAESGNPVAAKLRLAEMAGLPELNFTSEAQELAERFVTEGALSHGSSDDAAHVAIATVNGMEYLLTWNCRHIANPIIASRLKKIATRFGHTLPTLCTPAGLMGD